MSIGNFIFKQQIYDLSEVNGALAKVAGGGSKGKTILKISER